MAETQPMKQSQAYTLYDRSGRPIGKVPQPAHPPAIGRGQETVLLVRQS